MFTLVVMIQFLEVHPKRRTTIVLSGQKTNSGCWRKQQISKPRKTEGVNLEYVKNKSAQILFVSNLSPRKQQRIFSAHWGNFSRKIGLLPKSNSFVTNIEKLQTWGNKVEMVDRIVATFYNRNMEKIANHRVT